MQKIQPVHEVLSFFGVAAPDRALKSKTKSQSLAFSLISAFLIVIAVSLILNISTGSVATSASASPTVIVSANEPVAYQPGQFISERISRGYLGDYR